jgi:uncharacterized membrane protein YeaQ/YmgE (transglycosylase-associated protein family)
MEIVVTLIIGALAGWLGSMIYKGSGLGLLGNIIVGIFGSIIGYWLLGEFGLYLGSGWLGAILTGAIGAIIILFVLNIFLKKRYSYLINTDLALEIFKLFKL